METNPRGETDRTFGGGERDAEGARPNGLVPNRSIRSTSRAPWSRSLRASTYVGERPSLPMIDLTPQQGEGGRRAHLGPDLR